MDNAMKPKAWSILPRFRIAQGKEIAMGHGKADLLEHVKTTGSIAEAAKKMGMSYMRAWMLVKTMNNCFKEPIVAIERGGKTGGGATLTPTGEKALTLYREIEQQSLKVARPHWQKMQKLLRS